MASAEPLSEPQVLAHTKRQLFPADESAESYAVVDTQFATDEWLPGQPIPAERVVEAVDSACTGAAFLDLIDEQPTRTALTPLGEEVVRFAIDRYGSVDAALSAFTDWKQSRKRFCELAPEWGLATRRVVWAYPATQLLVTGLQTMAADGFGESTLVDLVEWLHVQRPTFTVELFVRGSETPRRRVLDGDGGLRKTALRDGSVYNAPTVFQLKTMLYHAGILAERGTESHRLVPSTDS